MLTDGELAGDEAIAQGGGASDEQRARIAAGEDVYVTQLNFGGGMTPINVFAGPQAFDADD